MKKNLTKQKTLVRQKHRPMLKKKNTFLAELRCFGHPFQIHIICLELQSRALPLFAFFKTKKTA